MQINGFRPGKVPVAHLRRVYGRSVMADVVQNAVNEANRKIVEDNSLKLALEPQIEFPESKDEVEQALEAKGDLAFTVALEVLPSFELADLSDVAVTKPVAEVADAEVDERSSAWPTQNRAFDDQGGRGRRDGDRVVDRLRRPHRRRASSRAARARTSASSSAPAPSSRASRSSSSAPRPATRALVKVTFPENYVAEHLAGKEAEFDVTVKEVAGPGRAR